MISSIRTWMFNKSLKQHSNFKSRKDFSGVNHCKTHCIIASADAPSKYACEKYKKKLEVLKKSVDILYFQNDKAESLIGYSRQNVKWNGVPQHEIIDSILAKEYDLLIFLNSEMEDHLKYLAILCNAKFKVGPGFLDCTHIFDLMIEIDDYSNTEKLIQNIDRQLKTISA
jgi:hypothetical protein